MLVDVGIITREAHRELWEKANLPADEYKDDRPVRLMKGLYLTSFSSPECHLEDAVKVEPYPLSPKTLEQCRGWDFSVAEYGSADDLEQILAYFQKQKDDPVRKFFICVDYLKIPSSAAAHDDAPDGPYIGTAGDDEWQGRQADHPARDGVWTFHIYEVIS